MACFGGITLPFARSGTGGGVDLQHNKVAAEKPTTVMPLPSTIVLPMQQHAGAKCEPQVKRKDHVNVGQLVGHVDARTTADIFSPVSGTVTELRNIFYSNGRSDVAVVIEPDGEQTVDPSIEPPHVTTMEELAEAVSHSGIVGLGGAGYPTHLKLRDDFEKIDTWLVNGAECEPYLSGDYREMLENADTIIEAISTCLDLSGVPRALICIERDKPKAIEHLRQEAAGDPRIQVHVLPDRYPQGSSRVIVYNVVGRAVPRGGHLTDVGATLFNVTTMSSIGKYLRDGMPLTKRRITVAGDAVANPQNLEVFIGTPIREVLDFCGLAAEPRKVISGGPMMGIAQVNLDAPILRQNSGLLAFTSANVPEPVTTACIRCGRCTNSCPMRLSPIDIQKAYRKGDLQALDALSCDLCMECGTCSYVCPAKQPLTQSTSLARQMLRAEKRKARRG